MTVRSQLLRLLAAGGHQFPAHQPHPAPACDPVHRLVQPDRAAAGARRVDRRVAAVFRPRPARGEEDAIPQHARLLHPRAQGRRAPDRRRPDILVSPCDAIVGACGTIAGTELYQAKGFPYTLEDLLGDRALVEAHRNGRYVTLRLTSSMYHRFHAPHDCRIEQVIYISGDTWNVNPIALKRVERLFCKNERAVVRTNARGRRPTGDLVAVAAILVASIRLHFLDAPLNLQHRGPNVLPCDAAFRKGEELGWFEHGSTIIVFAPEGFALCDNVCEGARVRVGEPLMRLP